MGTDPDHPGEITPLLERAHAGDREALDAVARLVHADLLRLARRMMAGGQRRGVSVTLDPQALVNETFVKLLQQRNRIQNREHFFAVATNVMIRVVADYDRARRRRKREGLRLDLSSSGLERLGVVRQPEVEAALVLGELEKLEVLAARTGRIAKLRILWGLSNEEIAKLLAVSTATVEREWRFARTWLKARL